MNDSTPTVLLLHGAFADASIWAGSSRSCRGAGSRSALRPCRCVACPATLRTSAALWPSSTRRCSWWVTHTAALWRRWSAVTRRTRLDSSMSPASRSRKARASLRPWRISKRPRLQPHSGRSSFPTGIGRPRSTSTSEATRSAGSTRGTFSTAQVEPGGHVAPRHASQSVPATTLRALCSAPAGHAVRERLVAVAWQRNYRCSVPVLAQAMAWSIRRRSAQIGLVSGRTRARAEPTPAWGRSTPRQAAVRAPAAPCAPRLGSRRVGGGSRFR
jgi:hypothetical protein